MKKSQFLFLSIFFLQSFFLLSQSSGTQLFDTSYVHTINIEFNESNFWELLEQEYALIQNNPYATRVYLQAKITIDGNVIDSVGIRQKGFFSNWGTIGSNSPDKKPFKVDLNEFVSGKKYDGINKFSLNNGFGDPTLMKEFLAYDMIRTAGIAAPRVSFANLYINGTHWGLYTIIEQINKTFLEENFSDGSGNLYKCIDNTNLIWAGENFENYLPTIQLKTNKEENDWSGFIRFSKIINKNNLSDEAYIDSLNYIVNVDEFLKVMAIDVSIGNWDSYFQHGRNFYLYHNPSEDKFYWIPWDYNLSFSNIYMGLLLENSAQEFPWMPLIDNMLAREDISQKVFHTFCNTLSYNFTANRLSPLIDAIQTKIEPHFLASSNEFLDQLSFEEAIDGQMGIKVHINNFTEFINSDLEAYEYQCDLDYANQGDIVINEFMAANDSTSNIMDQDGEFDDWIELYNNTDQDFHLNGYFLSDNVNENTKWTFPDVTIPAHDYLIIWADKDEVQLGLHSNFKLSKDGESVILSAPNSVVLDSVSFGEQNTEESFARLPNGTGDFSYTYPTFDLNNETIITNANTVLANIRIYPNPTLSQVNIEIGSQNQIKNIRLISMTGRTMLERSYANRLSNNIALDISHIPPGMYFFVIKNEKSEIGTQKLMIIK